MAMKDVQRGSGISGRCRLKPELQTQNLEHFSRQRSPQCEFNNSINSFKSRVSFIGGSHDFEHELELFVAGEGAVVGVIRFVSFAKFL